MSISKGNSVAREKKTEGVQNPVDVYVGSRVRLRRAILGLSQEKLAEELGVTFQQVQKYERGLNRISASRLWHLASVLGVSVNFFFENMDSEGTKSTITTMTHGNGFSEEAPTSFADDILSRKDLLELIRHYVRITDPRVAKNVLDLVKSITPDVDIKSDVE